MSSAPSELIMNKYIFREEATVSFETISYPYVLQWYLHTV